MAVVVRTPMTAADLASIRVGLDRAQLIGGVLVVPDDAPGWRHRWVLTRLQARFVVHRDSHPRAGALLRRLAAPGDPPGDAPGPDLWWVPHDDPPVLDTRSWVDAAPALVVTVPGTDPTDLLRPGVAEAWVVDADTATVVVHRPGAMPVEHRSTLTTPLVPGWAIEVGDLFTLPQ